MFAVHAPQSVTLAEPGNDGPFTLINFRVAGADTSRCVMEVVTPEGSTHRLTFNQRGKLVDTQFIGKDDAPEGEQAPLTANDYMVDGRDIRADNPYTHVAPVFHADPIREDVGFKQPDVFDKDGKPAVNDAEMRKAAVEQAAGAADKARQEREERANETSEQRVERHKREAQERRERAHEALDARTDELLGESRDKNVGEPDREPDGSLSSLKGSPEPSRDPVGYDPLIPAASSPLPGSPPPHRVDSPNPTGSVINTSQTARNPMMDNQNRVNTTETLRNG